MTSFITSLALSAVVATAQSPCAEPGIADDRHIATFLAEFQRAARHDERDAVAALMRYPITVTIDGLRVPLGDAAALLERWDAIFTPELLKAVAAAAVVESVDCRLKITALAVPRVDDSRTEVRSIAESTAAERDRAAPRRVAVRAGPRPTSLSGWLEPGASETYLIRVPKGQLLEVRLERVPVDLAVVRVVDTETGDPLNARASARARALSGRPPQDSEYRIVVQRTQAGDPAPVLYLLSVSIR